MKLRSFAPFGKTKKSLYSSNSAIVEDRGDSIFVRVRRDFDAIRDRFDTVHIPVRKSNTQMDCYFVWNRNVNQVIVIDRITFLKYVKNLVDVDCDSEVFNGDKIAYQEKFIDVPKHECKFYFLVGDYKLSDRVVSHEISGFLNYQ